MNWQLLGLSFVMVFLSELGDKSQLAAFTLSSTSKSPRAVFLGTATALILTSLIGVLAGEGVAQLFPTYLLKAIAAVGFALMGLWLLWPSSDASPSQRKHSRVTSSTETKAE
jgi:putative Ca2+/H+ antiporter (TMEM165/GDT1 family)